MFELNEAPKDAIHTILTHYYVPKDKPFLSLPSRYFFKNCVAINSTAYYMDYEKEYLKELKQQLTRLKVRHFNRLQPEQKTTAIQNQVRRTIAILEAELKKVNIEKAYGQAIAHALKKLVDKADKEGIYRLTEIRRDEELTKLYERIEYLKGYDLIYKKDRSF